MAIINHQLLHEPFFTPSWKIKHLFLGTFNPEGGEPVAYFYGRPRNFCWQVLSEIFDETFDRNDIEDLLRKLEKHQIACMDMIKWVNVKDPIVPQIIGQGYSDSKIINNSVIREYNTSSINKVIGSNPNTKVYSTWGRGASLRNWRNEVEMIEANIIQLVSPSPVARVPINVEKYPYVLNNWQNQII